MQKYKQSEIVRYIPEDGWANKYTVDVTFISSSELKEAKSSFKYFNYGCIRSYLLGTRLC